MVELRGSKAFVARARDDVDDESGDGCGAEVEGFDCGVEGASDGGGEAPVEVEWGERGERGAGEEGDGDGVEVGEGGQRFGEGDGIVEGSEDVGLGGGGQLGGGEGYRRRRGNLLV